MSLEPQEMTQCNCSICRRYAALWSYFSPQDVTILTEPQATKAYLWGDKEIEFHHCLLCGCVTHYVSTEQCSIERVGVNMRMATSEQLKEMSIHDINGAAY
ncbi:aldehyde-activating protein [Vibrio sp.]|nr:aldehyde-activating protein [Vibrio sp.]